MSLGSTVLIAWIIATAINYYKITYVELPFMTYNTTYNDTSSCHLVESELGVRLFRELKFYPEATWKQTEDTIYYVTGQVVKLLYDSSNYVAQKHLYNLARSDNVWLVHFITIMESFLEALIKPGWYFVSKRSYLEFRKSLFFLDRSVEDFESYCLRLYVYRHLNINKTEFFNF